MSDLQNENPQIFESVELSMEELKEREKHEQQEEEDEIDKYEVIDMIRDINDPEHPLTLEQLRVVSVENIEIKNEKKEIIVYFTPTIPHCSMATIIGLMIRFKLQICLPSNYKIQVKVYPNSHVNELPLNKQLNDKERVFAAMENTNIQNVIKRGVIATHRIYDYFITL